MEKEYFFIVAAIFVGLLLITWLIRKFLKTSMVLQYIQKIIDDTLKVDGRWSKTAIITASAWAVVLWSFHYDLIKNGFNITAWGFLLTVATGNKLVNAYSKKVDPTIVPPKETV